MAEIRRIVVTETTISGTITIDAADIDLAATYSFEEERNGKVTRWMGVKADLDGDKAIFVLLSVPIGYTAIQLYPECQSTAERQLWDQDAALRD